MLNSIGTVNDLSQYGYIVPCFGVSARYLSFAAPVRHRHVGAKVASRVSSCHRSVSHVHRDRPFHQGQQSPLKSRPARSSGSHGTRSLIQKFQAAACLPAQSPAFQSRSITASTFCGPLSRTFRLSCRYPLLLLLCRRNISMSLQAHHRWLRPRTCRGRDTPTTRAVACPATPYFPRMCQKNQTRMVHLERRSTQKAHGSNTHRLPSRALSHRAPDTTTL